MCHCISVLNVDYSLPQDNSSFQANDTNDAVIAFEVTVASDDLIEQNETIALLINLVDPGISNIVLNNSKVTTILIDSGKIYMDLCAV